MKKYIKPCSECSEDKQLEEFYNNRRRPDGKDNLCKVCRKQKSKNTYTNKSK